MAKILLLVENNPYPRDFRVRREAEALRDAGYQVTVIAPRDAGQRWCEDVEDIRVYRFPAPPGGNGVLGYAFEFAYATLAMFALTAWVALRRGVDVIHAANPPDTLFLIGALFKPFGVHFVFDHHDLAPETFLSRFGRPQRHPLYKVLRLLEWCSWTVADVVVATNESYKSLAVTRGGVSPDTVFVVRNGPPLSYRPLPVDPLLAARAKHIVGYVGTIGPQDGVDYWLRAVRELVFSLERRDFLAVIIGGGDALPGARALSRELGIEDHVWFTGRLPERAARGHLSAATVCVQPDPLSPLNDKSTMNKLMEYMALGKPTVAFDLLETRVSAGAAAVYVRPNDVVEFANRVAWLLDHPEVCREMGETGRRRVASALAWDYSVPVLLRAYRQGLRCAPAPLRRDASDDERRSGTPTRRGSSAA